MRKMIHVPQNMGEKVADAVCSVMGSWTFIIAQTVIITLWITLNLVAWFYHFDPAPFILLNLIFSTQAAYASPLILMSQNRQASKDRVRDDLESEEVDNIFRNNAILMEINKKQIEILNQQTDILNYLHETSNKTVPLSSLEQSERVLKEEDDK